MMIFGMVGIFFAVLYAASMEDIGSRTHSQRERLDLYMEQAVEDIKLVGIISQAPANIDVVNAGGQNLTIHELYVDGAADHSYLVDGTDTDVLPTSRVSRIGSSLDGTTITIITESGRAFNFG